MKKIILILLGIFIYNFLFAQKPFYKKGKWGVDFGANYYYPTINEYLFRFPGGIGTSDEYYSIEPIGGFGKYTGLFRTIKLNKTDDKNLFNALIGLSYNQRIGKIKHKCINYIQKDEIIEYKKDYFSSDIKLNSIVNLTKKYGVCNTIGFRTNFVCPRLFYSPLYQHEYYLTYSLGFLFYFKKINIMPCVDFEIINFRKNYNDDDIFKKESFNLINFGISIFFNNSFKNKKNEEK